MEEQTDFLTISNGVQLNMTETELSTVLVNNTALDNKIKPYLNVNGTTGACASEIFPLELTDAEAT